MILTYKYRIKDRNARKALAKHAWACNQVWNWCVARQRDIEARYRAGAAKRSWGTHFDLAKECNGVGADLGIAQHTVSDICRGFVASRNALKHAPRYRSSFGSKRSMGWVPFRLGCFNASGNAIVYKGRRYRIFGTTRRPVPATTNGGAFVEDAMGRWYVVFRFEVEQVGQAVQGEVGVDLGLKSLATLSTGEVIQNPRHLGHYAERLAVAQRAGNKRRVTAIHAKIGNVRRDYHHKLSTRLAREYAFIAVGDVNAKRLAKTRMAKSVLDAGWSTFRTMLRYKAAAYVEVDERFTTQTCSSCGSLPPERPKGIAALGIRAWDCSACGASHDRDVNAALNILRLARSVPRPVEESWRAA